MRARIWSAACTAIALGTTGAVLAQAPSSQTSQQSTSAKTLTVTGCVQPAQQQGTTGTTGTTPGASQIKFVLTNAALGTTATTGTTGAAAPPSTAIASQYKLDTDESKLSPHVGHKVEITGTVEQPSATEQKPPASAANSPTLKVDSVRMVATTCP